jgi:hypothetical protein
MRRYSPAFSIITNFTNTLAGTRVTNYLLYLRVIREIRDQFCILRH